MKKLGPRDSAAARRSWAEESSGGAPEGGRLKYEGAHVFGGEIVQRWRLGNGLTVLVLVDAAAPIASYHTWFKVGSRDEKPGKTGLAHLFEHLMFNETENLRAGAFDRKLEESGAETNAATWVDWTYYHESIPSDRVKLAVKLEAERMNRLVLREPQVASEKEVVANERRYRVDDDVEGAASELLYKTAFLKHPYRWPTIGWMEDIEAFSPGGLRRVLPNVLRAQQRDGGGGGRRARGQSPPRDPRRLWREFRANPSPPRTSSRSPPSSKSAKSTCASRPRPRSSSSPTRGPRLATSTTRR